jgi:hypothetical protein
MEMSLAVSLVHYLRLSQNLSLSNLIPHHKRKMKMFRSFLSTAYSFFSSLISSYQPSTLRVLLLLLHPSPQPHPPRDARTMQERNGSEHHIRGENGERHIHTLLSSHPPPSCPPLTPSILLPRPSPSPHHTPPTTPPSPQPTDHGERWGGQQGGSGGGGEGSELLAVLAPEAGVANGVGAGWRKDLRRAVSEAEGGRVLNRRGTRRGRR